MESRRWSHLLAALGIALGALFALSGGLGVVGAQPPGPPLTSTGASSGGPNAPAGVPAALVVLLDQTDSPGANSTASQDFETSNNAFDNQSADDFSVPGGQVWVIERVDVLGQYFNGTGPAEAVNVFFYSHAITVPGTLLAARPGLTYTNGANFSVVMAVPVVLQAGNAWIVAPVVLEAGHYWISVQADMHFTPAGQWGWAERTIQSGFASAWRNPLGGFGPACPDWKARVANCGVGTQPDHIFSLRGHAVRKLYLPLVTR